MAASSSPAPSDLRPDWIEALTRASRHLPPGDPAAQVFHESRHDLRVERHVDGQVSSVSTYLRGGRARRSAPRPRETFVSAPSPGELAALARGDLPDPAAGRTSDPTLAEAGPDPTRIVRWLGGLARHFDVASRGKEAVFAARWVEFVQRIEVIRAAGEVVTDTRRGATVRLEARVIGPDGQVARAAWERVLRRSERLPELAKEIRTLVDRASARLESRAAKPGPTSVVMAPGVAGVVVHELIGHALEADTVQGGASSLGPLGAKVAPDEITVLDDPRRGRGAWRIDDEGIVCGATSLIESGRVRGSLHDLATAGRAGQPPTGHGRRSSFREPIRPRMGCTFVAAGRHEAEEILSETVGGLYIRRLRSASTDSRSGTARFVVTDADRIDQGRIVHPVRPFVLELLATHALRSIDRVGGDLAFDTCVGSCLRDGQPLATSVGAPTMRIGVATVAE